MIIIAGHIKKGRDEFLLCFTYDFYEVISRNRQKDKFRYWPIFYT